MEKRTPTQKSIIRHKLKEIDKRFDGMKVSKPMVREKVLNKMK